MNFLVFKTLIVRMIFFLCLFTRMYHNVYWRYFGRYKGNILHISSGWQNPFRLKS